MEWAISEIIKKSSKNYDLPSVYFMRYKVPNPTTNFEFDFIVHFFCQNKKRNSEFVIQRVPALHAFWDLEKTVIMQKSPTCTYIRMSTMKPKLFGIQF